MRSRFYDVILPLWRWGVFWSTTIVMQFLAPSTYLQTGDTTWHCAFTLKNFCKTRSLMTRSQSMMFHQDHKRFTFKRLLFLFSSTVYLEFIYLITGKFYLTMVLRKLFLKQGSNEYFSTLLGKHLQHIEAETKWPPFRRRCFQMHFLEWEFMNFD